MISHVQLNMDQDINESEMEMEDHELEEILERENLYLEGFLKQRTIRVVDSLPQ